MDSGKIISFTNIRLPRPSFRFTNDMRPTNSEYVDKNATFKKVVLQFLSLFQYCGRLTFCNISVFKAGCIYQLITLGLFKFKMTLRRPGGRENVVGPPWLCVWRKVAVCVCQPPFFVESSQVRAAAPFGNFHLLVSGGAACPLLFSTSFTTYTFYPALQLASIRLSLVRTWLRIPGSLEGPLPPEPEPAGPVPT